MDRKRVLNRRRSWRCCGEVPGLAVGHRWRDRLSSSTSSSVGMAELGLGAAHTVLLALIVVGALTVVPGRALCSGRGSSGADRSVRTRTPLGLALADTGKPIIPTRRVTAFLSVRPRAPVSCGPLRGRCRRGRRRRRPCPRGSRRRAWAGELRAVRDAVAVSVGGDDDALDPALGPLCDGAARHRAGAARMPGRTPTWSRRRRGRSQRLPGLRLPTGPHTGCERHRISSPSRSLDMPFGTAGAHRPEVTAASGRARA